MARGRGGGRGRGPNSNRGGKHQQRKGPQVAEDEKLWRRLSQQFADDEELWSRSWNNQQIADLLIEGEKLQPRFTIDAKAEKSFRSSIDVALALGRKKNERFTSLQDKLVKLVKPADVEIIESAVADWKAFSTRHAQKGATPLNGRPPLRVGEELTEDGNSGQFSYVSEEDALRYSLLEKVWLAHLMGQDYPAEFTLSPGKNITSWGKFSLLSESRFIAQRRGGMRFPEAEPSMALLLYAAEHWDARQLLDARLMARRKANANPFPRDYDQSLCAKAEQLKEVDVEEALGQGRTDLRHLPFVTIDPHDAKDFDDAVCLVTENGVQTLWVAIADVAHYVRPNTSLDAAARARATSVYLPHVVLPMLPPRLADDLCSLREKIPRYAMVVAMKLDDSGEIDDVSAYEAIIEVKQNMAYEDALDNPQFSQMFALAKQWQQKELRLNISNAELRPRIYDDDEITVEVKWPNDATRMIESLMVATNSAIGHLLGKAGAPLPWRCHAPPDVPEVEGLNAKLEALGVGIRLPLPSSRKQGQSQTDHLSNLLGAWANPSGGGIDMSSLLNDEKTDEKLENATDEKHGDVEQYLQGVLNPEARNDILDSLANAQKEASELADVVRRVVDQGLFQLMQRANYSEENLGHFGLNLDAYVHFTSPIRRYPDLMAHRQLKAFLRADEWAHSLEETSDLAGHCSEQGYQAKKLEWELVANAYHLHLLRGGEIGDETKSNAAPSADVVQTESETLLEGKSWPARIVGLRTPWVFLDLADDGSVHGRMHLRQISGKIRTVIDEHGLEVTPAEPDERGRQEAIVTLGQKFPCRLRGLDIWSGSLDLAPIR